jgi:hypothetical protein
MHLFSGIQAHFMGRDILGVIESDDVDSEEAGTTD